MFLKKGFIVSSCVLLALSGCGSVNNAPSVYIIGDISGVGKPQVESMKYTNGTVDGVLSVSTSAYIDQLSSYGKTTYDLQDADSSNINDGIKLIIQREPFETKDNRDFYKFKTDPSTSVFVDNAKLMQINMLIMSNPK